MLKVLRAVRRPAQHPFEQVGLGKIGQQYGGGGAWRGRQPMPSQRSRRGYNRPLHRGGGADNRPERLQHCRQSAVRAGWPAPRRTRRRRQPDAAAGRRRWCCFPAGGPTHPARRTAPWRTRRNTTRWIGSISMAGLWTLQTSAKHQRAGWVRRCSSVRGGLQLLPIGFCGGKAVVAVANGQHHRLLPFGGGPAAGKAGGRPVQPARHRPVRPAPGPPRPSRAGGRRPASAPRHRAGAACP